MIPVNQIHQQAARDRVKERIVEKDFALTWFLLALSELPEPRNSLRFKGGTCIRKMYFPDWRYSEDIDFTLADTASIAHGVSWIDQIARKANQLSGITYRPLPPETTREAGPLESQVIFVEYVGPLRRTGSPYKFKIDLTAAEILIEPPAQKTVGGRFSDQMNLKGKLQVYSLEEICSEKLRSLLQRREPRDLYDLWRLLGEVPELDRGKLPELFTEKCQFKGITPPNLGSVLGSHNTPTLEKLWTVRLAEQLADLPPFDRIVRETRRQLRACEE